MKVEKIYIDENLKEKKIEKIKVGEKENIYVDEIEGKKFEGKVE